MRARIGLWTHEDTRLSRSRESSVPQCLGASLQTVSTWRKRIARQGGQGIREGERSARPLRIAQATRLQLTTLACEAREPQKRGSPALDEIVMREIQRRIVEQIGCSHVSADLAGRRRTLPPGPSMATQSPPRLSREAQCGLQSLSRGAQKETRRRSASTRRSASRPYIRHRSRLHFHFPPLHRSWVNQIEPRFARYRPRILSHASHTSIAHLRERTGQFIREHN